MAVAIEYWNSKGHLEKRQVKKESRQCVYIKHIIVSGTQLLRLHWNAQETMTETDSASKWQRYVPPCHLWSWSRSDTSSHSWVATFIPTWKRNVMTECFLTGHIRVTCLQKVVIFLIFIWNQDSIPTLYLICRLELVAILWQSFYLADLKVVVVTQCIKSIDKLSLSFSTFKHLSSGWSKDALVKHLSVFILLNLYSVKCWPLYTLHTSPRHWNSAIPVSLSEFGMW